VDGTETIPCREAAVPGTVLAGRYHLGEQLASGGWGTVFVARDLRDGSDVAVKILAPQHAEEPASVRRFLREQRIIERLHHPHVVARRDHGRAEEGLYIVMELLHGRPLSKEIRREGPLPPMRVARIASQICEGLRPAHEVGVIHRDLKPDNIFLCDGPLGTDFVKVMDFGIAKAPREWESQPGTPCTPLVYGTPYYVSPEQACAAPIDARSDLYSLGVVLFEMLSGDLPFPPEASLLTMQRRVDEPAPYLLQKHPDLEVPERLCDLVASLLERNPAHRPGTAAEVQARLAEFDGIGERARATPGPPAIRREESDSQAARMLRALDFSPQVIGRNPELERLVSLVRGLGRTRTGSAVVVAGPPGVGKSRLAGFVSSLAWSRGARRYEIDCGATDRPVFAFARIVEDLLGAAELPPDHAHRTVAKWLAHQGPGAAEKADHLLHLMRPSVAVRDECPAGSAGLVDTILCALARLTRDQPLIIVLDDLGLADPLTSALATRAPVVLSGVDCGLMLLATWTTVRGKEPGPRGWRKLCSRFPEFAMLIELGPLSDEAMDSLLRAIGPLADDARRRVVRLARGYPLHALQMLEHLQREHRLVPTAVGWRIAAGSLPDAVAAAGMGEFVRFRLEQTRRRRAGMRAVDVLERASMIGNRVPIALLRATLERVGRGDLCDVLPELLDLLASDGFVKRTRWTEDGDVAFVHAAVRSAVAAGFEARVDTQPVHLAIAEAMAAYASGEEHARAVALHYLAAGEPARTFTYAMRAATFSLSVADPDGAVEDFELAVGALRDMPRNPAARAAAKRGLEKAKRWLRTREP